jgi:hypothetical protein
LSLLGIYPKIKKKKQIGKDLFPKVLMGDLLTVRKTKNGNVPQWETLE